jgi:pentose-5-phosphate-3-epimerase
MGIAHVGAQGNPFDERILSDIADIHAKLPTLPISIDGHVSMFTLPMLKNAGATRFVVGSAILHADDSIKAFTELTVLANA